MYSDAIWTCSALIPGSEATFLPSSSNIGARYSGVIDLFESLILACILQMMEGLTAVFWAYLTHCHSWTLAISAVAASSYLISSCSLSYRLSSLAKSLLSPTRVEQRSEKMIGGRGSGGEQEKTYHQVINRYTSISRDPSCAV
jgi:hypothetical protein